MTSESDDVIAQLLSVEPYSLDPQRKYELLREGVLLELRHHYANSVPFQRFCKARDFDPKLFNSDLENIPPVPVGVFKSLGYSLHSVNKESLRFALHSSATSGQPSTVLIDQVTSKRQAKAMARVMSDFLGAQRRPFIVFDIDPTLSSPGAIGARRAAISAYLRFASEAHFVMNETANGEIVIDPVRLRSAIEATNGTNAIVFGFTYVLHAAVRDSLESRYLNGTSGVKNVLHIGGWKKLESEKVSREQFAETMKNALGVSPQDVIDVYGFTEQMGLNYPDCSAGWKHTPAFAEVFVRDQVTDELLKADQPGLLAFVSPIPHSYPGNVVVTEDLGYFNDDLCTCGRHGRRFKVLGRAQKAEVRGCGDILANSALRLRASSPEASVDVRGLSILSGSVSDQLEDDVTVLELLRRSVHDGQEWLREQPIDALIGLIASAGERWQQLARAQGEADLTFLASWCQPERLRTYADFSLRGSRHHVDGFRPILGQPHKCLMAHPRGLVVHWLSGNVPVLGMLTLIQSILAKNANVLKASSNHLSAIPDLLRTFEDLDFTTRGGHRVEGGDLIRSIAVVHFGRDRADLASRLSEFADARIAWGGAEAVKTVMALPRRPYCEDLVFGPKLSFMVIGAEVLDSEVAARRLARRAATDSSVFEQEACASPHNIFVETGGVVSPEDFAQILAIEMERALLRLPKSPSSGMWASQVRNARARYEFSGSVWSSKNTDWSVLFSPIAAFVAPTYSRVVTVSPVDDVMDTVQYASPDIQTVGLAVEGRRRLEYAEQVTRRGVERCPDIGKMTHFDTPWDGVVPMERLVRWTTLGGP
jgi:hypothetical protein